MHELGIASEVVGIISSRIAERGDPGTLRVNRVVLEIGKLTAVLPDSIQFCFDLCCQGTPLEGTSLEIIETPGIASCRRCKNQWEIDQLFASCRCGSVELDWLSGNELKIKEVEVQACAAPVDVAHAARAATGRESSSAT